MKISLESIGTAYSDRKEIKDDYWGNVVTEIKINQELFEDDCLLNLDLFSHIEVMFYMHKLKGGKVYLGSRHPRNNESFPRMGVFAQRVKRRFNFIGLSICNLIKVEDTSLFVKGLDVIDETPILDIKPYISQFGPRGDIYQPEWTNDVMSNYYKNE